MNEIINFLFYDIKAPDWVLLLIYFFNAGIMFYFINEFLEQNARNFAHTSNIISVILMIVAMSTRIIDPFFSIIIASLLTYWLQRKNRKSQQLNYLLYFSYALMLKFNFGTLFS